MKNKITCLAVSILLTSLLCPVCYCCVYHTEHGQLVKKRREKAIVLIILTKCTRHNASDDVLTTEEYK